MYEIDDRDNVVLMPKAPQPDIGAPLPVVVADESCVFITYIVLEPNPNWDGTHVTVLTLDTEKFIATMEFEHAYLHMFGSPNDEVFKGHPLWSRGLKPYSVSEVKDSSWIRKLERLNSVHPMHDPKRFLTLHHFIITFHDSTFECIARDMRWRTERTTIRKATQKMAGRLRG